MPISNMTMKDPTSVTAIFIIFRNVVGSFCIPILSTLVTRREQFHDLRIGENITAYSPATQARLNALQQDFMSKGSDSVLAMKQAYNGIKSIVRRDAFIMAFNDAFFVIGIGLLVAAAAVWLCKKPEDKASVGAH